MNESGGSVVLRLQARMIMWLAESKTEIKNKNHNNLGLGLTSYKVLEDGILKQAINIRKWCMQLAGWRRNKSKNMVPF